MTNASVVIFAEIFWNPGNIIQCEDRVHRIGQKKQVLIQFMVGDNTFDNSLYKIINRKLMVLGKSIDGVNNNQLDFNEEKNIEMDNEQVSQNVMKFMKEVFDEINPKNNNFDSPISLTKSITNEKISDIKKPNTKSKSPSKKTKKIEEEILEDSPKRSNMSLNEIDSIIEKHEKE